MQIKHLLIDLDDTLLSNSMDVFGPAYFKALGKHLARFVDPAKMIPALVAGTKAMGSNLDPEKTLEDSFDQVFYPQIGIPKSEIRSEIDAFYRDEFPGLKPLTAPIPGGVDMVNRALDAGYTVSVATNPLFPRTAITQRIEWAGFDLSTNPFLLIPSYEVFHFAKPNKHFYHEFSSLIGSTSSECVMVGNDLDMDIVPARAAGLQAFHIAEKQAEGVSAGSWGSITQVLDWVKNLG
jgi:FMN phosphatase YigB (HAD superfamily)